MSFPVCSTCGVELQPGTTCEHVRRFRPPLTRTNLRRQLKAARMTDRDWARMLPTSFIAGRQRTGKAIVLTEADLDTLLP